VKRWTAVLGGGALVMVAGTPACGQTEHDPLTPIEPVDLDGEPERSGERLRAIYWLSEQGLRVPTGGFLDTERDEECMFRESVGGDWRCFPAAVSDIFGFNLVDPECRTRVFLDCSPYAALLERPGCSGTRVRLHELGDVIDGAPRIGPDCEFSLKTDAGSEYRRLGERVPDDEFVRAVAGTDTDGERIGTQQLNAEDGSALLLGFFDDREGGPCTPLSIGSDEASYCAPSPFASVNGYFEDEDCSGDGVRLGTAACETPVLGYDLDAGTLYRLGSSVGTVPPFYSSEAFGCSESGTAPGYEVGEAVELDSFDEVEIARVGDGRIQMGVARSSDGNVVVPDPLRNRSRLRDDELGLQCSILVASDGEHRCLPTLFGTYHPNLFADDQCEIPLAALTGGVPDPDEPAWFDWTTREKQAGCDVVLGTAVYEVAEEPFEGQMYIPSSDIDGNPLCIEYTGTREDPLFVPGDEVPPEAFVRFDREVE
jgi:hypothetical protein